MYYLESEGTPREIGFNHGRTFRDEIEQSCVDWEVDKRLKLPDADKLAGKMRQYLQDNHPDLVQEVEGIAEGCGLPERTVFALTCRNSLSAICNARRAAEQCSSMAVKGADGRRVVAKTHDIDRIEQRYVLVHKVREEGAIPRINIGLLGSIWACGGLNEGGIAFGTNSGATLSAVQDGYGFPQHIGGFKVLKHCSRIEQVVEELKGTVFAGKGLNLVFGDASGGAVAIEKTGDQQAEHYNPDGPVFHTNHYLKINTAMYRPRHSENSKGRYEKLTKVLAPGTFDDPVAKLKEVLTDTSGKWPVCQKHTLTAWILDPKNGILWISPTRPEPDGFVCFKL